MVVGSSYEVFDDPYCYKGTSVLKNLAKLRNAEALDSLELEVTTLRAEEALPDGQYDPAHYRSIHHHLFQDVYKWAGKYRTVRIAKNGNSFCYPEHIAAQMNQLFTKLREEILEAAIDQQQFVHRIAHFLGELNAIHAFREGNGRTQLLFLYVIGEVIDYPMDLARIDPHAMLAAMIASFHGQSELLETEINRLLIR